MLYSTTTSKYTQLPDTSKCHVGEGNFSACYQHSMTLPGMVVSSDHAVTSITCDPHGNLPIFLQKVFLDALAGHCLCGCSSCGKSSVMSRSPRSKGGKSTPPHTYPKYPLNGALPASEPLNSRGQSRHLVQEKEENIRSHQPCMLGRTQKMTCEVLSSVSNEGWPHDPHLHQLTQNLPSASTHTRRRTWQLQAAKYFRCIAQKEN